MHTREANSQPASRRQSGRQADAHHPFAFGSFNHRTKLRLSSSIHTGADPPICVYSPQRGVMVVRGGGGEHHARRARVRGHIEARVCACVPRAKNYVKYNDHPNETAAQILCSIYSRLCLRSSLKERMKK